MTPAPIQIQPRCSRTPCQISHAPPISATAARRNSRIERVTVMAQTLRDRHLRAPACDRGLLGGGDHVVTVATRYRYPLPAIAATRTAAIPPARTASPMRPFPA